MRDMRAERGLGDPKYWSELPSIALPGEPDAEPLLSNPDADVGAVIDSWKQAAVFRISSPPLPVTSWPAFYVGWYDANGSLHRLGVPVGLDQWGHFAMRIGHEDVQFFIMPLNPTARLEWELVGVYDIDDPDMTDVPLY